MSYYEPRLQLTQLDPATNTWRLSITIDYPAGETGREVSNLVVGNTREIEIDVVADTRFKHDHSVTSHQTITRQPTENQVEVTTKKDGKKKGETIVVYSGSGQRAA